MAGVWTAWPDGPRRARAPTLYCKPRCAVSYTLRTWCRYCSSAASMWHHFRRDMCCWGCARRAHPQMAARPGPMPALPHGCRAEVLHALLARASHQTSSSRASPPLPSATPIGGRDTLSLLWRDWTGPACGSLQTCLAQRFTRRHSCADRVARRLCIPQYGRLHVYDQGHYGQSGNQLHCRTAPAEARIWLREAVAQGDVPWCTWLCPRGALRRGLLDRRCEEGRPIISFTAV